MEGYKQQNENTYKEKCLKQQKFNVYNFAKKRVNKVFIKKQTYYGF